jgi:glucose/arabinose dehydrogenase
MRRHVAAFLVVLLALAVSGETRAADRPPDLTVRLVTEGLSAPIFLVAPADGSGRRFVGDQVGLVYALTPDDQRLPTPFLDLRERMPDLLRAFDERGLWSLAFDPKFAESGRFFVTYSAKRRPDSPFAGSTAYTWRLSEFRVSAADPNVADAASERVLLEIDWANRKHNGGGLAFGPDGKLYVGVGDGGGVHGVPEVYEPPKLSDDAYRHAAEIKEDPFRIPAEFHTYDRYAQELDRLHGKILRLDVSGRSGGYAIPPTNPFASGKVGRPEIYAWGFRNPFRLSFDRGASGSLLVNGVAETLWETIYLVDRPGNYGWAVREGTHCFDRNRAFDPPKTCATHDALGEPYRDPIVEYANWSSMRPWSRVQATPAGTANVGGYIYRGTAIAGLAGRLVFGDFSATLKAPSGQVMVAAPPEAWGALWSFVPAVTLDQRLHSLGEDAAGELYLLTTAQGIPVGNSGKVWRLVAK